MRKVRLGIVGCGFVAHLHMSALRQVTGVQVEVVGVASRTRERAEAFARQYGIENYYTDYRYLLDNEDIDAIDVCVPNNLHEEVCINSAKAKKHIICEKPLTGYFGQDLPGEVTNIGHTVPKRQMYKVAMDSAHRILRAVEDNQVILGYAEDFVYAPPLVKAKRLIEVSGGTILDIRAEESHSGSHAAYSREWRLAGGGSLLRLGSHPLGAVLHLKHFEGMLKQGRPIQVKSVTAEMGNLTKAPSFTAEEKKWMVDEWQDVEDWAAVFLTFTDGTKAAVFSNDTTLGGVVNTVDVYLSNSIVKCNMSSMNACQVYAPSHDIFADEYLTEKQETKAGWSFPAPDEDWMRGYPQEMQDFMEAFCEGRNPVSDGQLGLEVVQITYASYMSAEEGRRIELGELEG